MQITIIAGTVGKDAEQRTMQSGEKVLNFSLAVNNGKDKDGNERAPTWWDCSIWGKRAEGRLIDHIKKGKKFTLTGRPSARAHDGKAYLGLTVSELTFMSSSEGGGAGGGQSSGGSQAPAGRPDLDDDIRF